MTSGVHQVAAGAVPRDAITNHLLEAQGVIRAMGLRSEIFVDEGHIHGELRHKVRPHTAWEARTRPDDVAVLHYSIGSEAFPFVLDRARSALHYHNVTPAELLWRDAPTVALECAAGRRTLAGLAGRVVAAAADSTFNADELRQLGFGEADVIGVLRVPTQSLNRRPRDVKHRSRLLFVGRGAPNKAQHDLILSLAALIQAGMDVELTLVGTWAGFEPYESRCRRLIEELRLTDRVVLAGSLSDADLAQAYQDADLFLCLSDHEGFCVPVIEAIEAGLPIVAYAAGALPETVGKAGLLLDDKAPSLVAEAVIEALGNSRLSARMAEGRKEQSAYFAIDAMRARLQHFVERLL